MSLIFICLSQNILHSLEGDRDRLEVRRTAHFAHGFGPRGSVHDIVRINSKHRIDYIIGVTANVFQVKLQPLLEKTGGTTG